MRRIGLKPNRDLLDTPEGMIPVTISLGVAVSDKEGRRDERALVKAADAALYKAKENGRNRVEVASDVAPIHGAR